jgi:hypothetical protein
MELHDMAGPDGDYENLLPFDDARKLFYKHGCGAFQLHPPQDCAHAPIANADTLAGIDMLQHALGDDIDGLASTLEDFRYAGMRPRGAYKAKRDAGNQMYSRKGFTCCGHQKGVKRP